MEHHIATRLEAAGRGEQAAANVVEPVARAGCTAELAESHLPRAHVERAAALLKHAAPANVARADHHRPRVARGSGRCLKRARRHRQRADLAVRIGDEQIGQVAEDATVIRGGGVDRADVARVISAVAVVPVAHPQAPRLAVDRRPGCRAEILAGRLSHRGRTDGNCNSRDHACGKGSSSFHRNSPQEVTCVHPASGEATRTPRRPPKCIVIALCIDPHQEEFMSPKISGGA